VKRWWLMASLGLAGVVVLLLSALFAASPNFVPDVVFKGNSPDETQVTQFGRSLEFSNGLFSNLNIEIKRSDVTNTQVVIKPGQNPDANKVQIVNFTVKCAYTPSKAASPDGNGATTASTTAPTQGAAAVQVAKN